jgi:DEAD/DEAH box helicase domain-containing protein
MIPVIFVDVETQNFFNDENVADISDLKISFAGAYDLEKDKYYSFWEEDLPDLGEMFQRTDRVVGYNIWAFDYRVLSRYIDFSLYNLPTLDLMVAMKKRLGFRPKLDDLAKANIKEGKIGSGLDAVNYWQEGKFEELEKYCLEDVRLTYEVWKAGQDKGRLKYYSRRGFIDEISIDWTDGYLQEGGKEKNQLGLI